MIDKKLYNQRKNFFESLGFKTITSFEHAQWGYSSYRKVYDIYIVSIEVYLDASIDSIFDIRSTSYDTFIIVESFPEFFERLDLIPELKKEFAYNLDLFV